MRSIKEIFVEGNGPSSSHTMGPSKAATYVTQKYKDAKKIKCTLYGSLAATGKGHLTDYIIDLKLKNVPHEIFLDEKTKVDHPNTMIFEITLPSGEVKKEKIVSIGGGSIVINDENNIGKDIYPLHFLKDILAYCDENKLTLADYVLQYEDDDILDYIRHVMTVMHAAIKRGISTDGELPGHLHIKRKAAEMYRRFKEYTEEVEWEDYNLAIATAAHAVAEENASGGVIVTAPTCGSAGVIPGCLAYLHERGTPIEDMENGMLVAGLIGIICKTNGSVSGAEAGCQAEIGVACAMGAALIAAAKRFENAKIAQAAEIAMEHSLGLTCDPVDGYVQVPCIERCAMYALKARNAVSLAKIIPHGMSVISFDDSVDTMLRTGHDMNASYRETSKGGLAKLKV